VLVGPSGCGKSTLLRLIAGLEQPSGGTIEIGGVPVADLAPKDRDVAMVFQSYALYPHMSVRENLAFSLRLRGLTREAIDAAVAGASERLGLSHLLERRPRQLAGGQRQRVAMGRALVRNPKVFLFDEPLSNLDARLREQMRYEIRRLQREAHTTAVYVTHDQIEAMTMADRIVAMNEGIAQQIGTPAELYGDPANRFVAEFIGSPAMNLLEATLTPADGGYLLSAGGDVIGRVRGDIPLREDRRVVAGIRPERIELADPALGLKAEVELVEPTGLGLLVHLRVGAHTVRAFTAGRGIVAGQRVGIAVDPGEWLLFDPVSGLRIRQRT
jgi:multiple sugar transport system ATP-binding protein